jgi:secondary thiamine-phosphate synthase enzyme
MCQEDLVVKSRGGVATEVLTILTQQPKQLVNVTDLVREAVPRLGLDEGAVLVFSPHTTAGVTVNEAWDPAVADDLIRFLDTLVPHGWPGFRHAEGNSDAHLLTSVVGPSVLIPVSSGNLRLGEWQGVFLCEFDGPRRRQIWVTRAG